MGRLRADGFKLVIVPEEARIIQRIFRNFIDGKAVTKIAKEMNAERVPTKARLKGGWNVSTISRILKDEKYIGRFVWNRTTTAKEPLTGKIKQVDRPKVADETFWRLMEGNGDNKRWQTWAVVAPDAVSYRILDSRSAAAAAEVLGDYAGTLLCDGYSAYESLKKRGGRFEIAHCWAHVRRKFVEAEEVHPFPRSARSDRRAVRRRKGPCLRGGSAPHSRPALPRHRSPHTGVGTAAGSPAS
jgi:transposase IS66 family protein/recombinase